MPIERRAKTPSPQVPSPKVETPIPSAPLPTPPLTLSPVPSSPKMNETQKKYIALSYEELYAMKHSIDPEESHAMKSKFFYINDMIQLKMSTEIAHRHVEEMESRRDLAMSNLELEKTMDKFTTVFNTSLRQLSEDFEAFRITVARFTEKIKYAEIEYRVDKDLQVN